MKESRSKRVKHDEEDRIFNDLNFTIRLIENHDLKCKIIKIKKSLSLSILDIIIWVDYSNNTTRYVDKFENVDREIRKLSSPDHIDDIVGKWQYYDSYHQVWTNFKELYECIYNGIECEFPKD